MPHAVPGRERFKQSRAFTLSCLCQTRVPIFQRFTQFVAHRCYILQVTFDLRQFGSSEASYLLAGCSAAIENTENGSKFIKGEPDRQCLPDHPDTLKRVLRVFPVTIAGTPWPE